MVSACAAQRPCPAPPLPPPLSPRCPAGVQRRQSWAGGCRDANDSWLLPSPVHTHTRSRGCAAALPRPAALPDPPPCLPCRPALCRTSGLLLLGALCAASVHACIDQCARTYSATCSLELSEAMGSAMAQVHLQQSAGSAVACATSFVLLVLCRFLPAGLHPGAPTCLAPALQLVH